MLTARERIQKQKTSLALVRLHRSLTRLKSTVTVMNTGAHPDDEQSGMLAAMRFEMGLRVIVACSTRGEGGQNALGPERSAALGVVRSREMEEAARELDADIFWLGHGPDDPVHDFGFSKNGDQTFSRWGEDRTVERLVRAYRAERPDIVIPTFLDVPGQHGHHRAMTRAAETAIRLASDPSAYPEHFSEGLTPWQVAKYYLPAWSGGGDTYDDEVPPPNATVAVEAQQPDYVTGVSFDEIGEWSRYYHASQGMGHWNEQRQDSWPLHLLIGSNANLSETSVLEAMPATLAELNTQDLADAQQCIDTAIDAFPNRLKIREALLAAARHIENAKQQANPEFLHLHGHRLERKLAEIDAALLETAQISIRAFCQPEVLSPGSEGVLTIQTTGMSDGTSASWKLELPRGVKAISTGGDSSRQVFRVIADPEAPYTGQYQPGWSALGGNAEASVSIEVPIGDRQVLCQFDLEEPLRIVPRQSVELIPDALIVRTEDSKREWPVKARISPDNATLDLNAPDGWEAIRVGDGWTVKAPADIASGLFTITPMIGDRPASRITRISYPHIGRTTHIAPALLRILALDLKLPEATTIGYIGGGADRVALWLERMGFNVTSLGPQELAGDLSRFTTIVVGIFTFGLRSDLAEANHRLHRFVEDGGHLVTLYHRPGDGWNPDTVPPRFLEIGSPSLRWRVTDPKASVTVLEPEHPLLAGPNRIDADDWQNWNKERGLYFASKWDGAYVPLLAMHDAGEQPLKGALLSARIGKGRHTHTSLVLHHQLDRLVPGAFRLMANMMQPAS